MTDRIGEIIFRPADCAILRLENWYSFHCAMNRLFRKDRQSELLWHFAGRVPEGLRFLYLSDADPVFAGALNPVWRTKPLPDLFPAPGAYRFQCRWYGKKSVPENANNNRPQPGLRVDAKGYAWRTRPLTPDEARRAFLRRSPEWGFDVTDMATPQLAKEHFRHGGSLMTLSMFDIEGCLTVTDPERFRRAVRHGVGGKTAFGCGLLRIASL